jgi:multidrug efflux pump subunit AcrA (membrane-fusion protein)
MKKIYLPIIVLAFLLGACGAVRSTPTAIPTVSLDTDTSGDPRPEDRDGITASAVVVPAVSVKLSFPAVGQVIAVDVNVGDRVSAGQTLVRLDTTIQEAVIREAEANLLAAEVQLRYNKRLGLDPVHLETSEAEVARMQALLDSANAVLATQFTLVAPTDGTVVSVDTAPAETVVPGQVVIVLGDLSTFRAETTDLSERDIPRVQIGQPAIVFIEALEEEFTGEVIDVDRISSTLGGDVVYKVTIEFDDQPKGLLWGMSADVQIETID